MMSKRTKRKLRSSLTFSGVAILVVSIIAIGTAGPGYLGWLIGGDVGAGLGFSFGAIATISALIGWDQG